MKWFRCVCDICINSHYEKEGTSNVTNCVAKSNQKSDIADISASDKHGHVMGLYYLENTEYFKLKNKILAPK